MKKLHTTRCIINCLGKCLSGKSSRIFFVSNYLLTLLLNHATNLVQTRYQQAEKANTLDHIEYVK